MILMTHLYYGDPSEEFSHLLARTLIDAGADILEIGVPYSDPVCDGPLFQSACKRALDKGITPDKVFSGIKRLREEGIDIPIYITSYFPPIFAIGVEKFVRKAKDTGATGLIVPDILLEEQEELIDCCCKHNLALSQFATVYTTRERLKKICKKATGFIYCISLPGTTGDPIRPISLIGLIGHIREITNKKVLVGFGIKSKKDAREILDQEADGIIIGSAIAQIYEDYINQPHKSLSKIKNFVKTIKESTIRREEL